LQLYSTYANQLVSEGRAYRCFCKPEELDQIKAIAIAEGAPPLYPGNCSHIPAGESERRAASGEPHCVRFKSEGHPPLVHDLVYGMFKKPEKEDDFILIKQDGFPTYHFANIVDDHLMEITHVIRGAEWLVSTPRHIALYQALGWQPPIFAHVGLLVDADGQKLSKRRGDVNVSSWRDRGTLPITLLNYVMLLGWSAGRGAKGQKEVMDMDEMISKVSSCPTDIYLKPHIQDRSRLT
jgi:glutamyl-tRNA synthetase